MKLTRILCIAAMLFSYLIGAAQEKSDTVALRVMTYNLRFGERVPMARLAEEINKYQPDFVALQEVDVNTNRTAAKINNGLNYVTELAKGTGMFGFYGRTIDFGNQGYYGIGLLSRYPAEKMEKFELPNPDKSEPRVLLRGVFELPGHKMCFASTHFDHISEAGRRQQAEVVVKLLEEMQMPAIIGGDFNSEPGGVVISTFDHMANLTNTTKTFPSDAPTDKIDYLFGYPKAAFELIECIVPDPEPAAPSDHLPVVSDIKVIF